MTTKSLFFIFLIVCGTLHAQTTQWKWETLNEPPAATYRFNDIFFVTPELGWAIEPYDSYEDTIRAYGKIYKTTDGGATWKKQIDSSHNHFRCMGFADSLHGWVFSIGASPYDEGQGYDSTLMYETTDGGATWTTPTNTIEGILPAGMCGMSVVNRDVAYAAGRLFGPAFILKTTNSGKSWKSIDMTSYAGLLIDCHFWSPDSGIVVGGTARYDSGSGLVLFTSDGGSTWSERHRTDSVPEICWKISFPSRSTGYVSVQKWTSGGTSILKTTDGGRSWKKMLLGYGGNLQGIGFINDTLGWTGGWGANSWQSKDGATKWLYTKIGPNLNRFRFLGDSLGYAAGQSIHKLTFRKPSSVAQEPGIFLAPSNYPNPFESATNIHFTLTKPEQVTLTVYNALGEVYGVLVNELLPAGEHNLPFAPSAASGAYFYILRCGSQEIQRQMIQMQ